MEAAFLAACGVCVRPSAAASGLSRLRRAERAPSRARGATVVVRCSSVGATFDSGDSARSDSSDSDARIRTEFREDIPLLNSVVLTGRLGQDPSLRQVGRNSTELCTFSLAVADDVFEPGAERTTSWFNVQLWGSSAARAASSLRKGLRVGITGTLGIDEWTSRDGEQRSTVTITANSFEILQSRSEIGFDGPRDFGAAGGGSANEVGMSAAQKGAAWQKRNISVQSGAGSSVSDLDEDDPF